MSEEIIYKDVTLNNLDNVLDILRVDERISAEMYNAVMIAMEFYQRWSEDDYLENPNEEE